MFKRVIPLIVVTAFILNIFSDNARSDWRDFFRFGRPKATVSQDVKPVHEGFIERAENRAEYDDPAFETQRPILPSETAVHERLLNGELAETTRAFQALAFPIGEVSLDVVALQYTTNPQTQNLLSDLVAPEIESTILVGERGSGANRIITAAIHEAISQKMPVEFFSIDFQRLANPTYSLNNTTTSNDIKLNFQGVLRRIQIHNNSIRLGTTEGKITGIDRRIILVIKDIDQQMLLGSSGQHRNDLAMNIRDAISGALTNPEFKKDLPFWISTNNLGLTNLSDAAGNIRQFASVETITVPTKVNTPEFQSLVRAHVNALTSRYAQMGNHVVVNDLAIAKASQLAGRSSRDGTLVAKAVDLIADSIKHAISHTNNSGELLISNLRNRIRVIISQLQSMHTLQEAGQGGTQLEQQMHGLIQNLEKLKTELNELKALHENDVGFQRSIVDFQRKLAQAQRAANRNQIELAESALQLRMQDRSEFVKILNKFNLYYTEDGSPLISAESVLDHISRSTGEVRDTLNETFLDKVVNFHKRFSDKVIGQPEITDALTKAAKNMVGGWARPESILLLGSTGTGKTFSAKTAAELLGLEYHEENMQLYDSEHRLAQLIGSPAGYVGYGETPEFIKFIIKCQGRSDCEVLFDEIEKAHPKIRAALLEFLDTGAFSDARGNRYQFDGIRLATTNAGAMQLLDKAATQYNLTILNAQIQELEKTGESDDLTAKRTEALRLNDDIQRLETEAEAELLRIFERPEVVMRFKRIFSRSLTPDVIGRLIQAEIKKQFQDQARERGIEHFEITPAVQKYIMSVGYHPSYGAREIKRAISDVISSMLNEVTVEVYLQERANGVSPASQGIYLKESSFKIDMSSDEKEVVLKFEYGCAAHVDGKVPEALEIKVPTRGPLIRPETTSNSTAPSSQTPGSESNTALEPQPQPQAQPQPSPGKPHE